MFHSPARPYFVSFVIVFHSSLHVHIYIKVFLWVRRNHSCLVVTPRSYFVLSTWFYAHNNNNNNAKKNISQPHEDNDLASMSRELLFVKGILRYALMQRTRRHNAHRMKNNPFARIYVIVVLSLCQQ